MLDANALGWKDMTFSFQFNSDYATLKIAESPTLEIGLDNQYRLTETPGSRPVVLRGRWLSPNEFDLEYLILGDFIESTARIEFKEDQLTLTIDNPNFGDPSIGLHGSSRK